MAKASSNARAGRLTASRRRKAAIRARAARAAAPAIPAEGIHQVMIGPPPVNPG